MTPHESDRHNRRILNTVRTGRLTLTSNETTTVQSMQVQLSPIELDDNVKSMQLFGFASASPVGTDALVLHLGGDRNNGVVVATNHNQLRPIHMLSGEVQVYDAKGQKIYLSQTDGVLTVTITGGEKVNVVATTSINLTAPDVYLTGNLHVVGTVDATGNIVAGSGGSGAVDLLTHRHDHAGGTGSSGGPFG